MDKKMLNADKELFILMENIKFLRIKNKLTKKEMAKIIGVGLKSLNQIEKGELPRRFTVKIFYRIYEHFGILPSKQLEPLLEKQKPTDHL